MKLNKRLVLGSMTLVLITLTITSLLFTFLINRQFNRYLTDSHLSQLAYITTSMEDIVSGVSEETFEAIGLYAAAEDYYIEVMDEQGEVVYQSQNLANANPMGRQMTLLQMKNMPMFSEVEVSSYLIPAEKGQNYLMTLGYNRGASLSVDALRFKKTIYYTVAIALVIASMLGYFISQWIARPLSREIETAASAANQIASGDMKVELNGDVGIIEIAELNQAITSMADTLSEQEGLRKDLIEMVNHEVKTPLTVLKSQIDAFLEGVFKPEPHRLEKCKDEIVRLEGLMSRMEDYNTQEEVTQRQAIMLYAPQYTNCCDQPNPHIIRMQESPNCGQILVRAGGDYVCSTEKDHLTVVGHSNESGGTGYVRPDLGDEEGMAEFCKGGCLGPRNKIVAVSKHTVHKSCKYYINIAELHFFLADRKIILAAGKDCPPGEEGGEKGPCIWPVVVLQGNRLVASDRVYASASCNAPCINFMHILNGTMCPPLDCS